jgi:hypothetical protein
LVWISIAAVDSLLTQQHASLPSIQPFSSELVQELTVMLLMMAQALLHARPLNTPLFSAPTATGTLFFFSPSCN